MLSMDLLVINKEDVLHRLNTIDIKKSLGSDGLHPRILYEARNEIANA